MKNKLLIIIPFLGQMQNQREKISISEIIINLRQQHLHMSHLHMQQMRIQGYKPRTCEQGHSKNIFTLFGSVMRMMGFDFKI